MADSRELEILLKAKNLTEEAFRAVERATQNIQDQTKKNSSGFQELRDSINSYAKDHEKSFQSIAKAAGLVGAGITAIAGTVVALGVKGSNVLNIERSFHALAASVGETDTAILKATSKSTKGLIADLDVMSAVNKGVLLGLPITSREMGTLGQTAVVLGKAMNEGPVDALNDLITGLGRGSPMILDNLGITLNAEAAYKTYAASIGKSADALTDNEKKLAVYHVAVDAASAKVEQLGGLHLTLRDRVQQGKVMYDNMLDSLAKGVALSPAVNAAFDFIGDGIQGAFGTNQQEKISQIIGLVNKTAIFLVDLGSAGVSTAKVLGDAFYGARVILFGVLETVTNIVYAVLDGNARITEYASKIPGIGKAWEGSAISARKAADFVGSIASSFEATKNEALDSLGASDRLFDSMNTGLSGLRSAMVAAAAAQKPISDGNDEIAASTGRAKVAVAEVSKQVEDWQKKSRDLNEALVSAAKNNISLTDITAKYGSTIEDVVKEAAVFGQKVPAAIQKAFDATNAQKFADVMQEIHVKTSEIFQKMADDSQKAQLATMTATSNMLAQAVSVERNYQGKIDDLTLTGVDRRLAAIERERKETIAKLGEPPAGMEAQWKASSDQVNEYYQHLADNARDKSGVVAGQLTGLANTLADTFHGIFGSLLTSAMGVVDQLVAQSADKFSGIAGFMNSSTGQGLGIGASTLTSGYGAGAQLGRGKGALAGAGQGALTGAAMGSVIPGIGTAIGAGIGAIGGFIGGLFGGGKKNEQDKADLKSIQDGLLDTYGTMDKLHKAADLVGVSIDKAFSTKKPEEAKKVVDELTEALKQQQTRLEGIATATDALNTRSQTTALGGLTGLLSSRDDAQKTADTAGQTALSSGDDKDVAAWDQAQQKLTQINDQISAVGATGQAEFNRLGLYATASFAGAVKETGDLFGAMNSLEPTFAMLTSAQKEFGYQGSQSLNNLLGLRNVIQVNQDVAGSVQGLNQIMQGLGQAGITNRALFDAFGSDAGQQIATLTSRNVDLNSQMALMQPTLQALWEGQQKYGNVTDESTSKMLAQAEQQGIVGASMQDVNKQMLDVLLAIGDALGAKIPEGMKAAADASEEHVTGKIAKDLGGLGGVAIDAAKDVAGAFDGLKINPIKVPYRYDAQNAPPSAIPAPGFAVGGAIPFTPGGKLVRVGERETERIVSDTQLASIVSRAMAAAGASSSQGGGATVHVYIGERELRPTIVKTVNDAAANGEVTIPVRNIVRRNS